VKDSLWNAFKLIFQAYVAYFKKDYMKSIQLSTEGREMIAKVLSK
jgi:hypothetical protein